MKKAIIFALGLGLIITLLVPQASVWSKRAFGNEPTFHQVIYGEYLSKISLQYYGTAKYWRELALLNRAPNSDRVFPGERVFIPSLVVIQDLHKARSSSRVNQLLKSEENRYAKIGTQPASDALFHIQNDTLENLAAFVAQDRHLAEQNLSFPIIVAGFGGLLLGGLMLGAISYKKRQEDGKSEPDYQAYRTNRSKRVYLQL